jgi:hypothetical protein
MSTEERGGARGLHRKQTGRRGDPATFFLDKYGSAVHMRSVSLKPKASSSSATTA